MRPALVEITVDEQVTTWIPGSEPTTMLVVKENQIVKITVILTGDDGTSETPSLFIEDYSVPFHQDNRRSDDGSFVFAYSSKPEKAFRESFGYSTIRLIYSGEEFKYHVEVLATKVTAEQTEKMIRYLSECREGLIRACMSRPSDPSDSLLKVGRTLKLCSQLRNTLFRCYLIIGLNLSNICGTS